MARDRYEAQVALLVRILPQVAKETVFAIKGGTAINLFYRDLPRLSVDIDLTYLPIEGRQESLAGINDAMDRIANAIETGIAGVRTQRIQGGGGGATRLLARLAGAEIKIETSPVTRGVVHAPDNLFGRPRAAELPAVRWKLLNLNKLKRDNAAKHAEQRGELEALLG